MGSSRGRRSKRYVDFREWCKANRPPCTLATGPWCTGVGLTPDHQPPIGKIDEATWWARGGQLHPACQPCQSRQGADLRNGTGNEWTW